MDIYDGTVNPFSHYISSTNLKTLISKASFSQNQEISQLSLAILDKINVEGTDYGMEIWYELFVICFTFVIIKKNWNVVGLAKTEN